MLFFHNSSVRVRLCAPRLILRVQSDCPLAVNPIKARAKLCMYGLAPNELIAPETFQLIGLYLFLPTEYISLHGTICISMC